MTKAWFNRWANGSGDKQLDLEWLLKQLHFLLNAKLVDGATDIVRADARKGNIRGARSCDPEKAEGVAFGTQRTSSERHRSMTWRLSFRSGSAKFHELEHLPQSSVADEVKMDLLLKIIPKTFPVVHHADELRRHCRPNLPEAAILRAAPLGSSRTARRRATTKAPSWTRKSLMTIGEVSTENVPRTPELQRSVEHCRRMRPPWKDRKDGGTSRRI